MGGRVVIGVRLIDHGAVVREEIYRSGPVAIGRGADCDFVVLDASVSRRHAVVSADETGTAWIEDVGSRNGLVFDGARVARHVLPSTGPVRCQLGAAVIEIVVGTADATLELTPKAREHGALRAFKATAFWGAGIAAWAAMMLIDPGFWSPWQQDRQSRLAWLGLGTAVGLPIAAFVLVGLLRIVGRKARPEHALRALTLVSWGWVLFALLRLLAPYALPVAIRQGLLALLGNAGVVASVAYLASVARAGPKARFLAAWAAALTLLLLGFGAVGRLAARQAGTPELDYDVNVPIGGVAGPASDPEAFFRAVRGDFATAGRSAEAERRSLLAARP